VYAAGYPVSPKEIEAEERGFQEEGQKTFSRQEWAKDITGKPGVPCPVHPELELHDDSGGDAYDEGDGENPSKKLCSPDIDLSVPCPPSDRLKKDQQPCQSYSD